MRQLSEHFNNDEFKCPCCGELPEPAVLLPFVARLQQARRVAAIPFVINSGYRCTAHNKSVGGKRNSSHLKGVAADIKAVGNRNRFRIIEGLIMAEFKRIGIGDNFIHVDLDSDKPQEIMRLY